MHAHPDYDMVCADAGDVYTSTCFKRKERGKDKETVEGADRRNEQRGTCLARVS